MYTIIIKTLIRWAVMNASAPSGSWSSSRRDTPSLMQRCSIVLDGKAEILIPRFTLLSWQFKDSSLRSESVHEC